MPWDIDITLAIGKVLAESNESHLAPDYLNRVAAWGHGGDYTQQAEALLKRVAAKTRAKTEATTQPGFSG